MHIQILGTGAAEGWPAVFCGCETCRRVRAAGGKDLRSRSSIQIGDEIKIDLPPDTYYHSIRYNLEFSRLKHLFITHSHEDHFALRELQYIVQPFAHNLANPPVSIYANLAVLGAIQSTYGDHIPEIRPVHAEPFVPITADNLTLTPFPAQHMKGEEALNYIVQSDSATVLYASDTGFYDQQTIDYLCGFVFDLLIIECTMGTLDRPPTGHMTFEAVLRLRDAISRAGATRPHTATVITHFSHNIGLLHQEIEAIANPEGVAVAYDGIEIEA